MHIVFYYANIIKEYIIIFNINNLINEDKYK